VSVINDEITKVAAMPRNWQRELLLAYIYEENNYDDVDILEKYESAYKMCDQWLPRMRFKMLVDRVKQTHLDRIEELQETVTGTMKQIIKVSLERT